jgi:hypothetical protein
LFGTGLKAVFSFIAIKNAGGQCPPYTVPRQETMEELILRVKEAVEFYIEERESVCAYDTAKADGGEIIPFEQAVSEIERVRRNTCSECSSSTEVKI